MSHLGLHKRTQWQWRILGLVELLSPFQPCLDIIRYLDVKWRGRSLLLAWASSLASWEDLVPRGFDILGIGSRRSNRRTRNALLRCFYFRSFSLTDGYLRLQQFNSLLDFRHQALTGILPPQILLESWLWQRKISNYHLLRSTCWRICRRQYASVVGSGRRCTPITKHVIQGKIFAEFKPTC